MSTQRGFSLVELVVTLAIALTLMAIAIPNFTQFIQNNQVIASSNNFIAAIHLTRTEAIKRNGRVTMCRSSPPFDSCITTTGGWHSGWILFEDHSSPGVRDNDEPILFISQPQSSDITIQGNRPVRNYISYTANGTSQLSSGAFQAGTVRVCNKQGKEHARSIVINRLGRPRTAKGSSSCPSS